jgi:hypothetical protein
MSATARKTIVPFPYGHIKSDTRNEVERCSDRWEALTRARKSLAGQERRALQRLHKAIDREVERRRAAGTL